MNTKQKKKQLRLLKRHIGHWCIVHYDDIGSVQALIVDVDDYFDVYVPCLNTLTRLSKDQLVSVGSRLATPRID